MGNLVQVDTRKAREIMMKKGFTVSELAKAASLSKLTVGQILSSDRRPNLKTAGKLARALGCDPMELLKEA